MLKRLKLKYGIERRPSDTGKDLVERLEATLRTNMADGDTVPEELTRSVGEFFDAYNAQLYGKENAMDRLHAIALSIDYQLK